MVTGPVGEYGDTDSVIEDFRPMRQRNVFLIYLKSAVEDGIVLAVKWSIVIAAILFTVNYLLDIRRMALNGQAAAEMIQELQIRGHLPRLTAPDATNK